MASKHIIDRGKPEFVDIPEALNGEVLLERAPDGGFITAKLSVAMAMKGLTQSEKAEKGWDKYQDVLDTL